jgi:hypothetical protein
MYWTFYIIFGLMFLAGVVAYWVISQPFIGMNHLDSTKDPEPKP